VKGVPDYGESGAAAVCQADACVVAQGQRLKAETDEAFDRAERRVRLLCSD
jgi:hypothetical protein